MHQRSPRGTSIRDRIGRLVQICPSGCWIWQGRITKCGYGQMTLPGQRKEYAHRASFEAFIRPIRPGFAIDHICQTKACVNPAHLEESDLWREHPPLVGDTKGKRMKQAINGVECDIKAFSNLRGTDLRGVSA